MKKFFSVLIASIMIIAITVCAYAVETPNNDPDFETNTDTLLLVNADTDEVIFSQNSDKVRVMASTTKIMTYIIVAETIDDLENTKTTIEQGPIDDVLGQGASMAGFQNHVGESFSVLDVLYGLMLPSGCDAAEILAYYVGNGNVQNFVDIMNKRAAELGCENTHFNDPHGLSDENHYTTAEDLYKITKYALTMPYFKDIVNTEFYYLPGESYPIINTNYLIDYVNGGQYYYPYATGIKTGYTSLAGRCLVSSATKGDTNFICIALGGKYDAEVNYVNSAMIDSVNLYKWAFDNFTNNIDISIVPEYKSIQLGEKAQLDIKITENSIDAVPEIKWSSSDTSIATVDENGVVTAVSLGEAKIKAETQTGNFDVCKVSCVYYNGIDVTSRYGDYSSGEKAPINWTAVKNYGFDFAIIRAGWGSEDYPNQNDASFVENVKGAVENDIPFGLNFVAYARNVETAKLEAEYLLREIEDYIPEYKDLITLPISYNMSDSRYAELNTEETTEIALEFNRIMNENGYKTMCYANKTIFANIDVSALKEAGMGLWYAYWPYEPDFSTEIKVNEKYIPEVWQYRSDGYIPEASENLTTKQSIIYMISNMFEKYQAPAVTLKQVKNEKTVEVKWEQVSYDILGYSVYRKSSDGKQLEKIADLNSKELKYTDTDLSWNESYTYFVAAKATDFLDKNYVKEIITAGTTVTVINTDSEATEPSVEPTVSEFTEPSSSETVKPNEPTNTSDTSLPEDYPNNSVNTGSQAPTVLLIIMILVLFAICFIRIKKHVD